MEKSSFFTSLNGDRKYKSTDFAEYFATFIGNGVFPNPSANLIVTTNGDMTVNLAPGFAFINGYMYNNTNDLMLTLDYSDGALKRIDRVVLRCDFVQRNIKAYIKRGSFASVPLPPSLERGVNAYEISIADIEVGNGVSSIIQSNITDTRLDDSVCGIVTQTVNEIDTTELYRKLQGYIDERGQDVNAWMNEATAQWEVDFLTWFDTIKDILDGDVAGNLARRIKDLEDKVGNGLTADNILIKDANNNFTSNNVEGALNELFIDVSDGKTLVATAITDKGVTTSSNDTFSQMASNIGLIYTGKKWATGKAITSSSTKLYGGMGISNTYGFYEVTFSNIGFNPSFILGFLESKDYSTEFGPMQRVCFAYSIKAESHQYEGDISLGFPNASGSYCTKLSINKSASYCATYIEGVFKVPVSGAGASAEITWIAFE